MVQALAPLDFCVSLGCRRRRYLRSRIGGGGEAVVCSGMTGCVTLGLLPEVSVVRLRAGTAVPTLRGRRGSQQGKNEDRIMGMFPTRPGVPSRKWLPR